MANHLSQCNCRKSAPRKLATRYLTKERGHDDFAPPGQFSMRPASGDAFRRKRDNGAAGRVPFAPLDSNKTRGYKRGVMMRGARVAPALVVILTIANILITPDPTDGVDGTVRPNHPAFAQRMLAVSLWEFQTPITVLFHSFTFPGRGRHLAAFELLDIISVCRC